MHCIVYLVQKFTLTNKKAHLHKKFLQNSKDARHNMKIIYVFLEKLEKKEMLNKLRKIHTNYQFFVAFEEPFADTFLLERSKLITFYPKNQQSIKFYVFEKSCSSTLRYH